MSNNKDFSVLKWFIFPAITVGLAAGIAYFNINLFGLGGSVLYLIALAVVNAVSLVLLNFSGSPKRPVRIAAFTFEGLLIAALLINIAYSLGAQRDLSLVRQAGADRAAEIEQISKLRGGRAQREALKTTSAVVDVRTAFGSFEAVLFYVMVAELGLSLGGLFLVYGLAAIKPGVRKIPRGAFSGARRVRSGASVVAPKSAGHIGGFGNAVEARGSKMESNGIILESGWNQMESNSNLTVQGQGGGVRIRDGSRYAGHVSWPKYLGGVSDPDNPTEAEIRALLKENLP